MKVDNLVLLESFFLPEYRNRLLPLLTFLKQGRLGDCKAIMLLQKQDLAVKEDITLSIDIESFTMILLTYRKALLNRLKAFKVSEPKIAA